MLSFHGNATILSFSSANNDACIPSYWVNFNVNFLPAYISQLNKGH